jgi:Phage integrase family
VLPPSSIATTHAVIICVSVSPGDELRAIKRYLATRTDNLPWLFVSERQAQLTRQAVNYIVRVAGETAKLGHVWPHMLRHSCGYYLADKGTDTFVDIGFAWAPAIRFRARRARLGFAVAAQQRRRYGRSRGCRRPSSTLCAGPPHQAAARRPQRACLMD